MRIGLCLPQFGTHANRRTLTAFAIKAEACGFDSLWVQEHLFWPHEPKPRLGALPDAPHHHMPAAYRYYLSPLEILSYVAAITETIRIGTSILVTAYHRPVELAKRAATLDHLSDGRLTLGLGLGVFPDEYDISDTPYARRGERASDFLAALKVCWGANPAEYRGPFFTIPKADTSPKPVQRDATGHPAIPILGAFGHASAGGKVRTARFCDIYNPVVGEASSTLESIVRDWDEINLMAHDRFARGPLQLYLRVFAKAQTADDGKLPGGRQYADIWQGGVGAMSQRVREIKALGAVAEIIVDWSFPDAGTREDHWIGVPDFFAPLIEIAHG